MLCPQLAAMLNAPGFVLSCIMLKYVVSMPYVTHDTLPSVITLCTLFIFRPITTLIFIVPTHTTC